ncbi:MAG TPA: putative toxin-antitoxin system toxin component, PIN family [Mucilaginibacter sp.]|jgi:putative PIN family toxin of toxin-antitoxin system|nr:putative toxin-antitoxin system toxin component, PIN family [Mucilaginibacter sp.]
MPVKKIRIILDTNWYVSATINKKSRRVLYELLTNKSLVILFSDEILKEYKQVI